MRWLLALSILSLALPAAAQERTPPPRSVITIQGEGTVSAEPDLASVSTGVVSEAKTAGAALEANSAAMKRVMAALDAAGIARRDIATSGFSVQPRYSSPPPNSRERPRITGYIVRNTVTVKVRDLTKLGAVLETSIDEGGNQVGGLSFDFAEPEKLMDEARRNAVADARRKAELYASGLGVKLGRVRAVSETGVVRPAPMYRERAMLAASPSAAPPISPGERELKARVTIEWDLEAEAR